MTKYSKHITILIKALLIVFSLGLFSCFKEDDPMTLPQGQSYQQKTIGRDGTGGVYDYEYYYDFSDDKVFEVPLGAYDLAFETNPKAYGIHLNTGKYMFVWNTQTTDFNATYTDDQLKNADWQTDAPSGIADSLAFKNWFDVGGQKSNGMVYILDRGTIYHTRNSDRYRKLMITSVDEKQYTIRYGKLEDTEFQEIVVPKDTAYTLSYLSFNNNGSVVKIAPRKTDWDVVFTNYIHLFNDQSDAFKNYLVRGTLSNHLNRTQSTAVENQFDKLPAFDAFSYKDLELLAPLNKGLNSKPNAIGYDWKVFDLQGNYVIRPKNFYFVQDQNGLIYKLRFTDFYNKEGKKGFPQFEFEQL